MMNEHERARFVLAVITNENLQISAPMAQPMAECQKWLEELSKVPEPNEFKGPQVDDSTSKVIAITQDEP